MQAVIDIEERQSKRWFTVDNRAKRMKEQIKEYIFCFTTLFSPKLNTQLRFLLETGKSANLRFPGTFAEKISWLKLHRYRNDPLVMRCADKLAVRGYVREKGQGALLNELVGVFRRVEDIPWEELPDQFVLKWNFGSGYNCILRSKNKASITKAILKLRRWERKKYWLLYGEFQYKTAEPCILCERFLDPTPQLDLLDYKFYCFHGEPKAVLVIDRGSDRKKGIFMTTEWEYLSDIPGKYIPFTPAKPVSLSVMCAAARELSRPFPFVRADFYEWRGQAVFGELTFTPGAGISPSETPIEGRGMGEYISLDQ